MAEYYTKAESDAKYAATSHTHALESMGGNNLPADRVEVPESVCASFDNAYTMDEALESIADQFSGKASTSHTHTGYAAAEHTHDYAAADHTHTLDTHDIAIADDSSVAFATTDTLFDALENLDNRIDGRAPLSHIHTNYAEADHSHSGYAASNHSHTGYAASGHTHTASDVGAAASGHTHTPADVGAAPASHTHGDYMTESEAEDAFAPINHSHSGYASAGHSHSAADVGAAPASHTHNYASSGHTHTASEVGAAAANHGHTGYADEDHTHTAAEVGALPASGGTVSGNLTVNGSYLYTAQIAPKDGGSYSIGSSSNRYYSTYLRVNPNVSSDRRCKRDIETMDINALAAFVNKLSVVNYNYNDDDADEAKRIGLIAQDVVAADPTIAQGCIEQDEKGFYSLRAADLVFPLIAAVQALTKRVEELEGK